jgi:hypothetical protein
MMVGHRTAPPQPVAGAFGGRGCAVSATGGAGGRMSTAVIVYSVAPDQLRTVPGSKNNNLLAATRALTGFFKTIDDIAGNRDEGEDKPPACVEAFTQIVNGEPYSNQFGYVYGYTYEGLCMTIGAETERSWTGIARSRDWFKGIDNALAGLNINLKLTDLLNRGALIPIPEPDDYPGLGWWTAAEVAEAATAFEGLDLNALPGTTAQAVKPVADAVDDIRSWVTVAAGRPGDWLIGIHS